MLDDLALSTGVASAPTAENAVVESKRDIIRGAASFIPCPYACDLSSRYSVSNSLQTFIGVAAISISELVKIQNIGRFVLLTLGISHKTAPIAVREKLAFSPERIPMALKALKDQSQIQEIALLSTCNRTEIYCHAPDGVLTPHSPSVVQSLMSWWQGYQQTDFDTEPYWYFYSDRQAVKHMMRVASGLDSMLLGEPQILGQLKLAYQMAHQEGTLGKQLSRWFQMSFSVAKRIRTQTEIAKHPISMAYAAVNLAKQIFADLSKSHVLLVGAGENIELILQHLQAKEVSQLSVVNRTLEKAQQLADKAQCRAYPLSQLESLLAQADIVITSINAQSPIIEEQQILPILKQKRRPLLMIDLGVPRNIDPLLGQHEDIYLYSVDDLQHRMTENLKSRESAAQKAEGIIDSASIAFEHWIASQTNHRLISQLRKSADQIRHQTLQSALKELEKGKDPQVVLTQFAHRLTQKLIHQPTVALRTDLPLERREMAAMEIPETEECC